jgi:hypothetical protein
MATARNLYLVFRFIMKIFESLNSVPVGILSRRQATKIGAG